MSVQVEKLEKSMAKLTIEVDAEKFEASLEKIYKQSRSRISIPGFRRGKAPRAVIERMYGADIFYEDAANDLIPDAYEEAADESGLEIMAQPKIDVVQIQKGEPLIFTAMVAVRPEVTLGQYKGIEVEKKTAEVTDEEMEEEIDKVREGNSRIITVEDRPVQDGDILTIDFEGFVDGEPFEGGEGKDHPLTIGSHMFIGDFEEQLIGKEIGVQTEVHVTFPEDYMEEELQGKPAVFHVTVKGIRVKEIPELDDDLVQDVSEFDTVDEYKEDLRKRLLEDQEEALKREKEEDILNKIIENAEMEIPDPMVEVQIRQMTREFQQRIQSQGLSLRQYMQFTGMTPQALTDELRPQALKRIQSRLVLEEIASAEGIEVSDEELDEEVEKIADAYEVDEDEREEWLSDEDREKIAEDVAVQKAMKLAVDAAVEIQAGDAQP